VGPFLLSTKWSTLFVALLVGIVLAGFARLTRLTWLALLAGLALLLAGLLAGLRLVLVLLLLIVLARLVLVRHLVSSVGGVAPAIF
jgi:hypothetical protein